MTSHTNRTLLGAFTLTLVAATPVLAQPGPPRKAGNPGVPGLLAQVETLEGELAATQAELVSTQSELATTQADLAETQTELTTTQTTLAATQTELTVAESELTATQDALAAIQVEFGDANQLLAFTLDELTVERARYRIPQTGQRRCWDAPTNDPDDPHFPTPCAFTGQDADRRAGLAPPPFRFVDNGDGTVTDLFTKLVWLKQADCADDLSWDQAVLLGRALTGIPPTWRCGLTDATAQDVWRLPNVHELLSLVDFDSTTGLPPNHPFTGNPGGYYWTSTTFAVPSNSPLASILYPCTLASHGYGQDNLDRFNEAYVVNLRTGETTHVPKEREEDIARRHDRDDGGALGLGVCKIEGFKNGTPRLAIDPRFIGVRDIIE